MADGSASAGPGERPIPSGDADLSKLAVLVAIIGFPLLANGYRVVIHASPDLRVAGLVDRCETAGDLAARLAPDLAVVGCGSSRGADSGLRVAIELVHAAHPATKILAIDFGSCAEPAALGTEAGADGVVARDATAADVLGALRCLGRGGAWPEAAGRRTAPSTPFTLPGTGDAFDGLSERTRDVFLLAAVGQSSREIARQLRVSERTVHQQRAVIMAKLGLHRRVELLRYALRRGIISATDL